MKAPVVKAPIIYTFILYACSLLLFLEWLYPVDEITDTSNTSVFILYTLFCFLISALNVYWWLSFLAKGMGLLFVINGLFFSGFFLQFNWLKNMWIDLSSNMAFLMNQDWYNLTPMFRSLLFLILIWLMSYLLYYWFVTMKYVFVFVALTIIYVTLLDTFTVYDAHYAVIRTVVFSLVALGLTNIMKEQAREHLHFPRYTKRISWTMPILVIILLSVSLGYFAPKFASQWSDPVPFMESMTNKSDPFGLDTTTRTVGYGEDDSTLGGSFKQDQTPVFQAETTEKQYWRIETKDVYTGKGWKRSKGASFEQQGEGQVSLETFTSDVETEAHVADITFTGQISLYKIIYPYGIEEVQAPNSAELLLDTSSESLHSQLDGRKVSLSSYTLTYQQPSFEVNTLQNGSETDPEDIKDRYTQLPANLPERVGEMADEITASYSNRYDKATAIEEYFGQNGFVYQISDVPVPEEDQDYVDQFLYDTKAGYCDNYSTAMVVMLRSIDIPARWVKGFTGGERVDEKEGPHGNIRGVYEVTNANAHSWVEVYFPDVGWVPFEPTQGFSNTAEFYEESDEVDDTLDATEGNNDTTNQADEKNTEEKEDTPENEAEDKTIEKNTSLFSYWYVLIILLLLIGLSWFIYYKRFHIQSYMIKKKCFRQPGDISVYQQAYLFSLRLLKHRGLEKGSEQTLREFANRVDQKYRGTDMGRLTTYYEQMVYNKKMAHINTDDFQEVWERLVKQVLEK